MLYVLDTHPLIWFLANDPRLGKAAGKLLDDASIQFALPAIVAAEASYIIMKRRTSVTLNALWQQIDELDNVAFIDLTSDIIRLTENLPAHLEMHDRQIIATAIFLQKVDKDVAIITKDKMITRSAVIPTVWE